MKINDFTLVFVLISIAILGLGCSSVPPVKEEAYALLKNDLTFENEFPEIWKAIENTFRNDKILRRSPDEVNAVEMKRIQKRTLETDWIFSQSRNKYQEYTVNSFPRKTYLQARYKYLVTAERVMGGVHVTVKANEEIERLKDDGSSDGYTTIGEPDPSRANEKIEKIRLSLLSQ